MKTTARYGFTLVELLVVLAVSGIMLSIIAIPMIQGFNLTRTGQAFANAQSTARTVRNQILDDLAVAAGVRFNPTPDGGLNLDLPQPDGTVIAVNFPGVKLDILLPALGDPLTGPSGAFIDPRTGMEDPTRNAPAGQVNLPAAPGMSIVRYWIGLRSPLTDLDGDGEPESQPYNDPYSGLLMRRNFNRDNLFVLYRAEVQPLVFDPGLGMYVPNTDFFADEDGDGQPDFDDPDFFRIEPVIDEDGAGNLTASGLEKVRRIANWRRRGTIITAISRYDMIQAKFDLKTRRVFNDIRDGVVPLIRFQPKVVSQEAVKGQSNLRVGEETHNPSKIGPEVYRTVYGLLSGTVVTVTPGIYDPPAGPGAFSSGGFVRPPSGSTFPLVQLWTASGGVLISDFLALDDVWYSRTTAVSAPIALFDMRLYKQLLRTGAPYPFTEAIASADAVNAANGLAGARTTAPHVDQHVFFALDNEAGELLASFDIRDVGSDVTGPFAFWQNRLPSDGVDPGVDTGPAETPNSDADISVPGSAWTVADAFRTINNRFNNVWARWNDFAPALDRARYAKRFVNLGQVLQPGGDQSPLSRLGGMTRATIAPGSETVHGPDQRPGPNYGSLVRYARISSLPVGPNQYYINYTDLPEPDWAAVLGVSPSYDPKDFVPGDFVSAVLQPQYRAGYLELNSRFGEPLPPGNVYVSYRFQFTETKDRVVVDYNTAELMEVVLTIKNFPQSALPLAQSVTVKGSTEVRNFFR